MNSLLVLPILLLPAASMAQPPQIDAANQLQVALQKAADLRMAQLAVHTSIAAVASPIATAQAQTTDAPIVLPPVPTVGVSPIVQWLLSVASTVLILVLPTALVFLKQHINTQAAATQVQTDATRSAMINTAVAHSAHTYLDDKAQGMGDYQAARNALIYVRQSHPDAIAATPQATDAHLTDAIRAEASRLVREAQPPVVVQTRMPLATPTPPPVAAAPPPPPSAGAGVPLPAFMTRPSGSGAPTPR